MLLKLYLSVFVSNKTKQIMFNHIFTLLLPVSLRKVLYCIVNLSCKWSRGGVCKWCIAYSGLPLLAWKICLVLTPFTLLYFTYRRFFCARCLRVEYYALNHCFVLSKVRMNCKKIDWISNVMLPGPTKSVPVVANSSEICDVFCSSWW